jgi:DHA3 family macrolide efflux protein-like MFS transporter
MTLEYLDQSKDWRRRFFAIWGGQAISLLGSMLVQFALIWYLTRETGSAMALAVASLISMIPSVILGPFVGVLVDRWNRRLTMLLADGMVTVSTLVLAGLFWLGVTQIWHIYALMLVRSIAGLFHWMAMSTSTTLMVPKEHLARIQGLNSMLNGSMNIAAAPLGALLMEILPMQGVLAVDILTAMFAMLPLLVLSVPQPVRYPAQRQSATDAGQPSTAEPQTSVMGDLKVGLGYVFAWPGLLAILGMALMINFLLGPAGALMPLLVSTHFEGQAIQYAALESLFGFGAILGGLLLGMWGGFRKRIFTSMLGLMVLGFGSILIGIAPSSAYVLAVTGMFIVGFAGPIVNGPLLASLQAAVEPAMQGRVFSLVQSGAAAITPLGLLLSAPVAEMFGIQSWYVAGGIMTILMGILGFAMPAVMNFEEGRPAPSDPAGSLAPLPIQE